MPYKFKNTFKEDIKRYSDVIPYKERKFWYFTTHGVGLGTIPRDLKVLEVREGQNDNGTWGFFVCLDGVLNTSELKEYDMKEMMPREIRNKYNNIDEELSYMDKDDHDYFKKQLDNVLDALEILAREAKYSGAEELYRSAEAAFTELESNGRIINEELSRMNKDDRDYFKKQFDKIYDELEILAQEAYYAGANKLYKAAEAAFTELDAYAKEINESVEATKGVHFTELTDDMVNSIGTYEKFKEKNKELIKKLSSLGFKFLPDDNYNWACPHFSKIDDGSFVIITPGTYDGEYIETFILTKYDGIDGCCYDINDISVIKEKDLNKFLDKVEKYFKNDNLDESIENPREIKNKLNLGVDTDEIVRDVNGNDLSSYDKWLEKQPEAIKNWYKKHKEIGHDDYNNQYVLAFGEPIENKVPARNDHTLYESNRTTKLKESLYKDIEEFIADKTFGFTDDEGGIIFNNLLDTNLAKQILSDYYLDVSSELNPETNQYIVKFSGLNNIPDFELDPEPIYDDYPEDDIEIDDYNPDDDISESYLREDKDSTYRGIPNTRFIWHGEWADPEVLYTDDDGDELLFNYYNVEDVLYSEFMDDMSISDDDPNFDEEFKKYAKENGKRILDDLAWDQNQSGELNIMTESTNKSSLREGFYKGQEVIFVPDEHDTGFWGGTKEEVQKILSYEGKPCKVTSVGSLFDGEEGKIYDIEFEDGFKVYGIYSSSLRTPDGFYEGQKVIFVPDETGTEFWGGTEEEAQELLSYSGKPCVITHIGTLFDSDDEDGKIYDVKFEDGFKIYGIYSSSLRKLKK